MNKTFKLNGVNVELSKEQLQEMLKEFNKKTWTINRFSDWEIVLKKNGDFERRLINAEVTQRKYFTQDFSKLVYIIAEAMGYLATPKQILDEDMKTYQVYYNAFNETWDISAATNFVDSSYIIDTLEHAWEIAKLLNNSPLIKEWLDFIKGDE